MPPRLSITAALRQLRQSITVPAASFSTTFRAAALKDISHPSKALLGLGGEPDSTDMLRELLQESTRKEAESARLRRDDSLANLKQAAVVDAYMREMPRVWRVGDVYSPRDLGPSEMAKWRKSKPARGDVLDQLGINPLESWKNMSMISEHMTKMGRIRHSRDTGLRPVNQRRMAKAVRRAIGMGLHPSIHKHPELLRNDPTQQRAAGFAPPGSMTRL